MESQYPKRLSHATPTWIDDGSVYHIRIRVSPSWNGSLIDATIAHPILESVSFYQRRRIWNCRLFLLMPDHLHVLLSFNPEKAMSRVIGNWKGYLAKELGIEWQDNYFDHRIRNETEQSLKHSYILNNPVAKGLCSLPNAWPWKIGNSEI